MMKCYLDSNIVIYLKDENSPKHRESKSLVSHLISKNVNLVLSPLCLDEFIHETGKQILKDFGQKNYFEKILLVLNSILELPNLLIVNPPIDISSQKRIVEIMKEYNLRPRDAYHLLTMQANKIDGFATFDNDFRKVFAAKILKKA